MDEEKWTPVIGEKVVTTREVENFFNKIEKGSIVTIKDITERGYDLETENGFIIRECGWSCVRPLINETELIKQADRHLTDEHKDAIAKMVMHDYDIRPSLAKLIVKIFTETVEQIINEDINLKE